MLTAEKQLRTFLDENLNSSVKGLKLRAFYKGQKKISLEWGKTHRYYDLASLTKVMFTVPLCMDLLDQGLLKLSDKASDILPWYPHKQKISELLSHCAGNTWWQPIYKQLSLKENIDIRRFELMKILKLSKAQKAKKAVYSDIDFFVLGFVFEKILEKPLAYIWEDFRQKHYGDFNLMMNPYEKKGFKKIDFASTEKCSWRKETLQGKVHDQNCYAFGGISTHAGLFSSIEGVSDWMLKIRQLYLGKTQWFAKRATLKKFSQRAMPAIKGDWSLGFMLPTKGVASCGKYFDKDSFGHTGFTGTSLWFDPKNDWIVVILANKTNYGVENKDFKILRAPIHDKVMEIFS